MLFQVWHELRNILMVMILLMLYLVLWVPYIVMVKGDQVKRVEVGSITALFIERTAPLRCICVPRSANSGNLTRWRFTETSPTPIMRLESYLELLLQKRDPPTLCDWEYLQKKLRHQEYHYTVTIK